MNKRLFFVFLTSLSKVPRREILQVDTKKMHKSYIRSRSNFDPSKYFFCRIYCHS